MGNAVFRKVQYGKESSHGTPVAADTMLLCRAPIPEADREVHIPTVDMGVRTNRLLDAAVVRKVLADGVTIEDADGAYFEMLPVLLSMGILNITPAEQNGGEGDYLWTAAAPQTGAETVDSVTLEIGDDSQGYEIAYCLCRSLNFKIDCVSGEVHVSANCFGDQVTPTTLTGAISVPSSVEMMVGSLCKLYIDDTWAGVGTTEFASSLISADVTIETGVHPKFFGSGQRTLDSHGQNAITAVAKLTLERNATVVAEEAYYRPASGHAVTTRHMRLELTGGQIGSGDNHTLVIDMAGVWTGWQSLGSELDGNTQDVVTLTGGYDVTGAQGVSVAVTTDVASI